MRAPPPGVSADDFAQALQQFADTVGKPWVFTSDEDVDLYRDAYSPYLGTPEERVASAAVAPDGVEQVQQIVRIANQYKIPLYTISTGKNLGYGGSAPVYSGSVVLDLKRMNRVLEVNENNAYAVVEPGVSYFDLYRYIQERKLKVWIDVPDPGWGSPMGNALDRGGGYTRSEFRNHFDAHCGLEVVLPNGELMRTGMGAMPNAKTWQQYKSGFGPWIDGLFSQSNFGIVTKMGFWLMPEPEAYLRGTVLVSRHDDLIPLVETLNSLENSRITNGMPDLGSPLLGILEVAEYAKSLYEPAPKRDPELADLLANGADPKALEAYAQRKDVAYWSCSVKFYGPEPIIRAQWDYAKGKFAAIPGARFKDPFFIKLPLTEADKQNVHRPEFGVPSLSIFSIGARSPANPDPTHGHMWFSPIIPRTGEAILEANRVFADAAKQFNMPVLSAFSLPSCYWERAFIYIFGLPISTDPAVNTRSREIFRHLIQVAAEHGWGEYRTAPAYQDDVMATYSFNNHQLLRFHETIKDAIDPNGVLSPGRYGIWPRHIREARL